MVDLAIAWNNIGSDTQNAVCRGGQRSDDGTQALDPGFGALLLQPRTLY